ncbi:hypothetical protein [Psychroserpens sp.]|jgi:hypothetical protein|uniref:hypothetical protein n=1 Tax=Psychroserpens sp. TaxID=2020870 RepID=UPI0039E296AF
MKLYELGGDNKKLTFSYNLNDAVGNRLQTGYVDHVAISSLGKLVSGGINNFQEIQASEMALKSLIFHTETTVQMPSVKVQIYGKGNNTQPLIMSKPPELYCQDALQDLYSKKIINHSLGNIHQLKAFHDDADAINEINFRKEKATEMEIHYKKHGIPKPMLSLFGDDDPLELLANSYDDFFNDVFIKNENLINNYIKPMIKLSGALYIGEPMIAKSISNYATGNAEQFFNVIEDNWKGHLDILKRRIEVPIPIFLTIVLNRAKNREDIPRIILELREEFSEARFQLWSTFDEADFRLFDTNKSIELLNSVKNQTEFEIKKITGTSYQKSSKSKLDFASGLLSIAKIIGVCSGEPVLQVGSGIALLGDIKDLLEKLTANQSIRMEAPRLTVEQLKGVELKGLLEDHLSEKELIKIGNSI